MRYSLLVISDNNNGYWIQDKFGELEEVKKYASEVSKLNCNQDIAVVDKIMSTKPHLNVYTNFNRL